jgi:phosphoadenosine phosphosulfate reductase
MSVRGAISGHIIFTSSFGIEDQAITHAIFTQDLDIEIVTFDTRRFFSRRWRSGATRNAGIRYQLQLRP